MMFKFYVRIQVVPFGGAYTPEPCMVCQAKHAKRIERSSAVLPKRSLAHLAPKNGVVECDCGHRFLCHGKDKETEVLCPICATGMKKIKL
jgi:hypothetical protein